MSKARVSQELQQQIAENEDKIKHQLERNLLNADTRDATQLSEEELQTRRNKLHEYTQECLNALYEDKSWATQFIEQVEDTSNVTVEQQADLRKARAQADLSAFSKIMAGLVGGFVVGYPAALATGIPESMFVTSLAGLLTVLVMEGKQKFSEGDLYY